MGPGFPGPGPWARAGLWTMGPGRARALTVGHGPAPPQALTVRIFVRAKIPAMFGRTLGLLFFF